MNTSLARNIADELQAAWREHIHPEVMPERKQFVIWAQMYGYETALEGLVVLGRRLKKWNDEGTVTTLDKAIRYASGVMRNVKQQNEIEVEAESTVIPMTKAKGAEEQQ